MRKLIPAVFALFAASVSHALGFGEMALHSALNQPLDATVELVAVKPSERDSVEVRIPGVEMFERFGISRNPVLDDVRVEVADTGGDRLRVTLSTQRPVREPFLTLLLEADWDGGRALREYTVLLDPPTQAPSTPAASSRAERETAPAQPQTRTDAADEPASEPAEERPAETSRETPPARAQAPERQRAPTTPAAEPEYRRYGPVAPDETLWSIAYELRPDPQISMDQMLLAIYQSNPQAFDDNINRLNAGSMLIIPDAEEIRAIDETVARQEIADQKREYARSERTARSAAAAQPEPAAEVAPSGEAPPAEEGELRLEPPTEESEAPAAEAVPTEDGEDAAAGERIAENAGATARALAEAADDAEVAEEATEPGDAAETADTGETDEAEESGAVVAEGETETQPDAESVPPEEDAASADGGSDPQEAEPGTQPGEQAAGEAATAADEPVTGEPATDEPATDEPAAEEPVAEEPAAGEAVADEGTGVEPVDEPVAVGAESVIPEGTAGLLTSRNVLLALAALLLVFAIFTWMRRRQYKPVPADFSERVASGAGESPAQPAMAEEDEDDWAEPAPSPSAESVDEVLADADSYIEHELYEEALAALKVGMEQYPGNPALRRKALEVHYAAGARDAFLAAVESYSPRPAADDPEWLAIAAMGRELAPDDPMFADAPAPGGKRSQTETEDEGEEKTSGESDTERSFDSFFEEEEQTAAPGISEEATGRDATPDLSWFEEEEEDKGTSAPVEDEGKAPESGSQVREPETPESETTSAKTPVSGTADDESTSDVGDDFDLDFDWSGETTAEPSAEEDRPETGDTAERRDDEDTAETGPPTLDIDLSEFDVGADEDRREADADKAGQTETGAAGSDEDEFADFDFDSLSLDEGDRPAASEESPEAGIEDSQVEEGSAEKPDFEASEGMSLDEPSDESEPERTDEGAPETGADEPGKSEDEPSLDVDFGGTGDTSASADEPSTESGAAAGDDAETDEVTTKLDLARAYLDMGEPDMARSLLEDVKDQGNAEQRREAEELLERAG